jgi:hypothetical protein
MNNQETSMILARIAEVTGRQVDDTTIVTWQNILVDVEFDDAVRAVTDHFRDSDAWIMPRNIVERAHEYHRAEREAEERARRKAIDRAAVNNVGARQPGRCISREGHQLIHHFSADSGGWCLNNCGWRDDGQSSFDYIPNYPTNAPRFKDF